MTPLQLSIVLHYYASQNDYRSGDFTAPAVREAIDGFKRDQVLIDNTDLDNDRTYELGPRGLVFVEHLMSLDLPTIKWVMQL